jgi:23S rRNA pseudouridine2605 synthase
MAASPRYGLARTLSKLGVCSRSEAERLVRAGRVRLDGRVERDPERPVDARRQHLSLDDTPVAAASPVYVMLNKPRGIVVSAADERGRDTVYSLLADSGLPWLGAVGRLDKASEGLLLLSNDTAWAAAITAPESHVDKTYHVQVRGHPDAALLARMREGVVDAGETLAVHAVQTLREGERNAWLEVVLDEGRNRHIRRLFAALGFEVQRLLRVAIGTLALGDLPKGAWRHLVEAERDALHPAAIHGAPTC